MKFKSSILFIMLTIIVFADNHIKSPLDILKNLQNDIYVRGEVDGNFKKAEVKALDEFKNFIKNNSDKNLLIEKNSIGQTPLIISSFMGYDFMVKELLKHDIVKRDIDRIDDKNATAWMYSNFAFRQSVFACHGDALVGNPFSFVPLLVTYPFYSEAKPNRYKNIRQMLEEAGATPNQNNTKKLWMDTCKKQDKSTKKNIQNAKDMLDVAILEGNKHFQKFLAPGKQKNR